MTIAEQNQKYMDDMALTMQLINQRPGRMIQLASLLNRYASKPKYFGDNDYITLIEMGILVYIASFPGVTNATLCEQFGRTKGAISQLIRKLEDRGYIQREPKPEDAKSFLFYPSLKGMHLIQKINENDQQDTNGTLIRLFPHGRYLYHHPYRPDFRGEPGCVRRGPAVTPAKCFGLQVPLKSKKSPAEAVLFSSCRNSIMSVPLYTSIFSIDTA